MLTERDPSSPGFPRHTNTAPYRCSLPDLAGFGRRSLRENRAVNEVCAGIAGRGISAGD